MRGRHLILDLGEMLRSRVVRLRRLVEPRLGVCSLFLCRIQRILRLLRVGDRRLVGRRRLGLR